MGNLLSTIFSPLTSFVEYLLRPLRERRRLREARRAQRDLEALATREQKGFRYEALVSATGGFSEKNKLGEGGFGPVYRGRLADGREVAVKRLSVSSRQGGREFKNEAVLLSRLQHKNVVNLLGYCDHAGAGSSSGSGARGVAEKLLVYEYVANESLDKLIFQRPKRSGTGSNVKLDWQCRFEIITGIARGVRYLHEDAHTPIIHRDIKASNILLDERLNPKIADFGMARLFPEGGERTHVQTRIAGTNAYMAPEYLMNGVLSTKSDVFSYGVLVLEIISGQKNSSFMPPPGSNASTLLDWAWRLHRKGQITELLDPAIKLTVVAEEAAMCVHIALLCLQTDPKLRPDMKRVVNLLARMQGKLEEPARPGTSGAGLNRLRPYRVSQDSAEPSPSSSSSLGFVMPSPSSSSRASTSNVNTGTLSSSPTAQRSPRLPSHQEE